MATTVFNVFRERLHSRPEWGRLPAIETVGGISLDFNQIVNDEVHAFGVALKTLCSEDETITYCGLASVEALVMFLGANAVGKVVNYVFPEFIAIDPVGYVQDTGSKTIVATNVVYQEIANSLSQITLDRVVIAPFADYSERANQKLFNEIQKNTPKNLNYEILSWDKFIADGAENNGQHSKLQENEIAEDMPNDIAALFYTGGSTDAPKAIEYLNSSVLNMFEICQDNPDNYGYSPGDRFLFSIPPGHAAHIIFMAIIPMLAGCTVVVRADYDVSRLLEDLRLTKPTYVLCCVVQLLSLTQEAGLQAGELSYIKRVYQAGEKMYAKDAHKINATLALGGAYCGVRNLYGMTETGLLIGDGNRYSLNWITIPKCIECRLMDESGNIITGDGVGQLEVLTPARARGYRNNPEATRDFFGKDGWTKTGNISARKTAPYGVEYYDILGRNSNTNAFTSKDGTRIYGPLVDQFLAENNEILRCMTVALPVTNRDESHILTSHIALAPTFTGDKDELLCKVILACQKEFHATLMPAGFKVYDGVLPTNATTHKIDIGRMASDYAGYYNLVDGKLAKVNFQ